MSYFYKFQFYILISLGLFLTAPVLAQAFSVSGTYPDAAEIDKPIVISIDDGTIEGWRGFQKIAQRPQSYQSYPTLSELISGFLGQASERATSYHNYQYRAGDIFDWLLQQTQLVNRPSEDAALTLDGSTAVDFMPGHEGFELDLKASTEAIIKALETKQDSAALVFNTTSPEKRLGDTNSLGIQELVAHGESHFNSSPANRRHNIAVGMGKMKGIVVPQGAVFSFNEHLGPVEASTGFLPELVIKKTGTVPEFGGGLCQVSSTLFRAAMKAGLPITERRNHSYAVSYYAPQGTDATIYPGVIDLKFVNDTPGSILIWPSFKDTNTLYFDIYGTKDTRQVTLDTPVQYDKKPDGSMKATWGRVVVDKDGVSRHDVFKSVYQPPALFHKEEMFVTAAPASTIPSTTPLPSTPTTPEKEVPKTTSELPKPTTPPTPAVTATN